MQNFDYQTPTRLIFGKGVISNLPDVMSAFGKKILMTYGSGSIKKIGLYDKVKELLKGYKIYELPDIQPNPKYDPSVLDGVRICKEKNIDVVDALIEGYHSFVSQLIDDYNSSFYYDNPQNILNAYLYGNVE